MVVNSPLFYSMLAVHKWQGLRILWGYAPQQFLFLSVFFPFATVFTFSAIYLLINKLGPTLPDDYPLLWFFRHWPVSFLLGAIIVSMLAILVYFSSAWSLDKLQPKYAHMAINAINTVENQVHATSLNRTEQEDYRDKLIRDAKREFDALDPLVHYDPKVVDDWLNRMSPHVLLQVFQDPDLQIHLRLVNPTILGLNVLQLFFSLLVAFGAIVVTGVCCYSAKELNYDGRNMPELTQVIRATFYAVYMFGFYPICYGQYRAQVTDFVGTGTTVLQDIFVAALVVLVLVCLKTLDPYNRGLSLETLYRFLPIIFVGSGSVISTLNPQLMRQLIGNETKLGIQLLIMLFVVAVSSVSLFSLYNHK